MVAIYIYFMDIVIASRMFDNVRSNSHMKKLSKLAMAWKLLKLASQHLTVTVLLEYIDLFTTCVNTMLGSLLLC